MGESYMLTTNVFFKTCLLQMYLGENARSSFPCNSYFFFEKIVDIELLKLNGCKIYLCQRDHKGEEK